VAAVAVLFTNYRSWYNRITGKPARRYIVPPIAAPKPLADIVDKNRYQLIRKIADGGMGSVFEAVLHGSEGFRKTVAVKMIREEYSSNPEFIEMFIGEAKLVADLVHQNIVQIYQLGKCHGQYFMAMEYIKGVNLQQFIKRHQERNGTVPIELAAFIVSRVCRGLEYAHKKRDAEGNFLGVVHRDVSPKNLMISAEGEVKITDFGIAKARNLVAYREGEVLMGKIRYMSPEQAQYLPTDRRSDIFSLSVVLYELLTGATVPALWDKTADSKPLRREFAPPRKANPAIPEALERILMKGLEGDVTRRYQRSSEMAYDLEYYMYHKGYGPTIKVLEEYMAGVFPEVYTLAPDEPDHFSATASLPCDTEGGTV
jgi:serine/threonine-protein kinase